jgi:molybdopterin/thiamine biosynthesis adenylyltransferase/proteasome lid subunit RPN8/RPN11
VTERLTLVLSESVANELLAAANEEHESAAVLLVRPGGDGRFLVRQLEWVPATAYDLRTERSLSIRPDGYLEAIRLAEACGDIVMWCHTHPAADAVPTPSKHDDLVDKELRKLVAVRAGITTYGSLVVSRGDRHVRFTGRIWQESPAPRRIDRMVIVGTRLAVLSAEDVAANRKLPGSFDRQVRAFGGDVQRVLQDLRVGIVGAGGTGSAVAEQLVRLGVGSIVVVDPKNLSESNPTRVYGSTPSNVGMPKADVLSNHLRRISPSTSVETVVGSVVDKETVPELLSCDVIFGCTDDNAGRLVLSRIPTYYFVPVIDLGVLLSSQGGRLTGIDGRVTVVMPGTACLVCRDRIDLARAAAEQLPPDEQSSRAAEGYAPELGAIEPAVIAYTTGVASFAVAELLERLIGYGPEPEPGEVLLRFHERETSTNIASPRPHHYCSEESGLAGLGDTEPFLGQTWR